MQYLIVGDPHAVPKNLSTIQQLFQIVEQKGITTIWLGDLLHTKEIVQSSCLNAYFHYFRESSLNHIILVGNHDQHTAGSTTHSLEPLKTLDNVTVVDKPMVIDNMAFVPYYSDLEALRETIEASDAEILFAHLDIIGCDYGNSFLAQHGLELSELSKFKRVISGHFHRYQEKGNLVYLGTPFSHSFGESNQIKYLATFDNESNTFTINPTSFAKHMTYEVDCDSRTTLSFAPVVTDYNRVILRGTQTNIDKFEKHLYPDIKFMPQATLEITHSAVKESDTPIDMFQKWASEIKQLDNKTIDLGLTILKDIQ